jgi:uncharacterized protein (TIGR02246 family)
MKNLMMLILVAVAPLLVWADGVESVESEIRELEAAFNAAYATNDLDTYFANYTKDATLYFYGKRQPVEAYSEEWYATIAAGGVVIRNDVSDLEVRVLPGGEAAVATFFVNNQFRSPDDEVATARAFETDVWQKTDDGWRIVSLHYNEIAEE